MTSSRRAAVITCSTRAQAGVYADATGPRIVETFRSWGFEVADADVVADGEPVGEAIRSALAAGADVVVTTGGTGVAPGDLTPEATRAVVQQELPGLAEALRAEGVAHGVPTAVLSRGVAGVATSASACGRSLVLNLPGSTGGVKDGLAVLGRVLDHTLDQLAGGDHRRDDA